MDPSSKYCSKIQQQPLFSVYSAGKNTFTMKLQRKNDDDDTESI